MKCPKCKKQLFAFPITFGKMKGTWAVGCPWPTCKISKLAILGRGKTEDDCLVDFTNQIESLSAKTEVGE